MAATGNGEEDVRLRAAPLKSRASVRRLEFHLSYACAQSCLFCSESGRMARWRSAPVTGEEIARVLIEKRREGFDHVTFTGGEPSAHPLLPSALRAARRLGFRTYLTTNGGRFAEESYARKVLALVDELCLSVHGPDAATHDACVGKSGSFARAMAALENVERHGLKTALLTNTVATRLNWARLEDALRLIRSHPKIRHCLVSHLAPEGRAARAYGRLAVSLPDWRRAIPTLADVFDATGVTLRFFGLPLCVLGERRELSNDAHFSPRATVERRAVHGAPGLAVITSLDASRRRSQAAPCARCAAAGECPGVFDSHLKIFGSDGLRPL